MNQLNTPLFYNFFQSKIDSFKNEGGDFVHYSTAEAVKEVIVNGEVWLRSPSLMNDRLEIEYGYRCVRNLLEQSVDEIEDILESFNLNIREWILKILDELYEICLHNSFIFCISEHCRSEDIHGRLSMWRGYGGSTVGVAIVIPKESILGKSNGLKSYAFPALYYDDIKMRAQWDSLLQVLKKEVDSGRYSKPHDILFDFVLCMQHWVLTLKHEGFKEEKEWRLIYQPADIPSQYMKKDIVTIKGIPQVVYKLPLINDPDNEIFELEVKNIVKRLIIGPNNFPLPLKNTFVDLLNSKNVENSEDRVVLSEIPLRL